MIPASQRDLDSIMPAMGLQLDRVHAWQRVRNLQPEPGDYRLAMTRLDVAMYLKETIDESWLEILEESAKSASVPGYVHLGLARAILLRGSDPLKPAELERVMDQLHAYRLKRGLSRPARLIYAQAWAMSDAIPDPETQDGLVALLSGIEPITPLRSGCARRLTAWVRRIRRMPS